MENNPTKMNADLLFWNDDNALDNASKVISSGGIIVYPTDTVYGFGVDATNENSINRLNNLKNRTGPISVIASGKNVGRANAKACRQEGSWKIYSSLT